MLCVGALHCMSFLRNVFFLVSDCDNTTELQTEMEGNQNVSERKHRLVQGGDKHQS